MFSIIVPIYKVEKYLPQCIESILAQTYKHFELILVDDGSPDNCPQICDEYAKKDSRIKVVHKTNGGVVSARKAGVSESKGEYVTFVDGDDWVDFDFYNRVFKQLGAVSPNLIKMPRYYLAKSDAAPLSYHSAEYAGYYNRQKLENEVFKNFLYKEPFFNFGISPSVWSCIFKRDVLEKCLYNVPNEICMGDDLAVTIPCATEVSDIYFSDVCGYYYRQNDTSITHVYNSREAYRINILLKYLYDVIKPNTPCKFRYQSAMYAVFMTYSQLVCLLRFSTDERKDLELSTDLLNNPLLLEGMKEKLPFKVRFIINSVKKNRKLILKILRKMLRRKNNE